MLWAAAGKAEKGTKQGSQLRVHLMTLKVSPDPLGIHRFQLKIHD